MSQELFIFYNFQHSKIGNFAEEWLDNYLDYDFFQLFRFQKQTVRDLLSRIDGPELNVPYSGGGLPIPAYKQLLVTLWWLGKGETSISVGDKFNLAISTVYSITEGIVYKLVNLKEAYIKWPTFQEMNTVVDNFRRIGGYPGVVGAVDCCNIEFKLPHEQQDSYINKNSKHSIKLQGIVTSNKIFTNINVGFPGSAHDSRVLKNSNEYVDIMTNNKLKKYFKSEEFHLVGDKAYPLLSWLMTPYKWRILHFIDVKSEEKAVRVIVACCVVHNFGYLNYDYCDDYTDIDQEAVDFRQTEENNDEAIVKRYDITQQLSRLR
ncbi:hypothetical protein JTB14_005602 [Gonioctena quinquepunctata]|nr:hypothetical protein JTB14_005602 [Gonioctena quinquepunctata]